MSISMETSLPENVLESLNKFADVRVIDGEIPIYDLVDSRDGYSLFLGFLGDDKEQFSTFLFCFSSSVGGKGSKFP